MKVCTGCKVEKSVEEFGIRKRTSPRGDYDYVYARCKKCRLSTKIKYERENKEKHLISRRKFYANNQEREVARRAKWRKENKEKHRAGSKIWAQNNPERVKGHKKAFSERHPGYASKIHAKLIAESLEYRLARAMRSRFHNALKKDKTYSIFDICDYTVGELKTHLESLFTEGMSWDNYGQTGWVIDHIRPLASFDIVNKEEMTKAWTLSNLQPLWASENSKKSSMYEGIKYTYNRNGSTR
jgi:5-methylcytosine-specific restriction endonuclease McrA